MAGAAVPVVAAPADHVASESLACLQCVLGGYHPRDFVVRLWDGTRWDSEPGQPARFVNFNTAADRAVPGTCLFQVRAGPQNSSSARSRARSI